MSVPLRNRIVLTALLSALGVLFYTSPAEACRVRPVDVFTQADQAATVAIGTVVQGGIQVEEVLKGRASGLLSIQNWQGDPARWTSCVPRNSEGEVRLVFLDRENRFLSHYQSSLLMNERANNRRSITTALRGHLQAEHAEANLAHLVALAAGSDLALADEAARYLLDKVEWVPLVNADHRRALREAVEGEARHILPRSLLLIRWGEREMEEYLERRLRELPSGSRAQLGLAFMDVKICGLTVPADYPSMIEGGPDPATRAFGLHLCELHLGRSLSPFLGYYTGGLSDRVWKQLARECADGVGVTQKPDSRPLPLLD